MSLTEWRMISSLEGLYQASSDGHVRRAVPYKNSSDRPLSEAATHNGYRRVHVSVGGKPTCKFVHRLVAEAFQGPPPEGMQVNHVNGDKADNRPENLEYVTSAENTRHAINIGLRNFRGVRHWAARLSEADVRLIQTSRRPAAHLARELGISASHAAKIRRGEAWMAGGAPSR